MTQCYRRIVLTIIQFLHDCPIKGRGKLLNFQNDSPSASSTRELILPNTPDIIGESFSNLSISIKIKNLKKLLGTLLEPGEAVRLKKQGQISLRLSL